MPGGERPAWTTAGQKVRNWADGHADGIVEVNMTRPIDLGSSSNSSYYDPADNMSRADGSNGGAGGANATSGAGGSEGAGNVQKAETTPDTLHCLPEAVAVARDCGAALLLKRFPSAVFCGVSLGALGECLGSSD